jgi:group I intron endonuclease
MHYLYRITDILSGKVYIGQSSKETERWRQHRYFARQEEPIQYIHRAMKKYGVEHFVYEVIATCKTREDADETEIQLIKQYDSRNPMKGYNLAPGGDHAWNAGLPSEQQPMYGKHHSEESKKKISASNMGKEMPPHTDDWKKQASLWLTGRPCSEETKEKRSKSRIGILHSEDTKRQMSKSRMGKYVGENHPNSKLTWDIVKAMRDEYLSSGITYSQLATKYGLSRSTVSNILNNKAWVV